LSSPYILKEGAAALSFSLKLIVSAEVLSFTAKSLGGMMQDAKIYAEIPQLFALVGVTFVVGLILETVLGTLATVVEKKIQ
jgi:ABC-type nitrate/sulfonate/bicarbonate transport system permease component